MMKIERLQGYANDLCHQHSLDPENLDLTDHMGMHVHCIFYTIEAISDAENYGLKFVDDRCNREIPVAIYNSVMLRTDDAMIKEQEAISYRRGFHLAKVEVPLAYDIAEYLKWADEKAQDDERRYRNEVSQSMRNSGNRSNLTNN